MPGSTFRLSSADPGTPRGRKLGGQVATKQPALFRGPTVRRGVVNVGLHTHATTQCAVWWGAPPCYFVGRWGMLRKVCGVLRCGAVQVGCLLACVQLWYHLAYHLANHHVGVRCTQCAPAWWLDSNCHRQVQTPTGLSCRLATLRQGGPLNDYPVYVQDVHTWYSPRPHPCQQLLTTS